MNCTYRESKSGEQNPARSDLCKLRCAVTTSDFQDKRRKSVLAARQSINANILQPSLAVILDKTKEEQRKSPGFIFFIGTSGAAPFAQNNIGLKQATAALSKQSQGLSSFFTPRKMHCREAITDVFKTKVYYSLKSCQEV